MGLVLTMTLAQQTPWSTTASSAAAPQAARPNVLIIVTDDQRSGLGVMPVTKRVFVEGGARFGHGFATDPQCCPSRASIFTGRYAHNHNVRHNTTASVGRLDQQTTIQYYLQRSGYHTGIFGKYLNGWPLDVPPPYFDEWAVALTPTYYEGEWNVNGINQAIPDYSTAYIGDRAVHFLQRLAANDDPWLMYLAPFAPHGPFTAEDRYTNATVPRWSGNKAVFESDKSDKPRYVRRASATLAEGSATRAAQYRTLMSVDDLVGRVFSELEQLGEANDTLAFFVSDNGFLWGEHGVMAKTVPYTQSVKVPMMMRWPGHVAAGVVDQRIVGNIDIAPTVLAATGAARDPNVPMDGRSLLNRSWTRPRILLENWGYVSPFRPWASIRSSSYQYIEYYGNDGETVHFREYYDLEADPWQLRNLLHDGDRTNNPRVRLLRRLLDRDRACAASDCP